MYRTIFVIDNAINNNRNKQKGGKAFTALSNHNLRLAYKNALSFIDEERNNLNEIWLKPAEGWINVNNDKLRKGLYKKLNHKYQQILNHFKQQLKEQNSIYEKNKNYDNIKTFNQYQRNKKICGDWIVAASREWFIANQVIIPEGKRKNLRL